MLKNGALEQLKDKHVSVEDLCDTITPMYCLQNDTSMNVFVDEWIESFYSYHTVWSYLSYHLLEHVICQYSLEYLRKQMEEFKAEVDQFKEETPLGVFAKAEKK